ncbi:MAG TPA: IPT/TIG domain-containing protein [Actinoplanes sp.]|jgi:hypothetical protein
MRTSQSRTGPRLLSAGIAVMATAAAVLAGTATPALAVAPTVTVAPPAGSNSGSITATSSGFLSGVTAPATIFATSACADPYATATTNITATTVKTSDDVATITVPATLSLNSGAARTYYVCTYNGTTAGTSALKGQGTYVMAPAATPTATSGASGGGNTLTVNLPAGSPVISTATVSATFTSGGCPATYGGSPSNPATATKVSTTQVTIPVPVGVGGPDGTKFAICLYPASATSTSGLIAASSATAYTVNLPAVTLSSTIGPASTNNDPVNLTITGSGTFLTGVTTPAVVVVAATANCTALYTTPGTNLGATGRKVNNSKAAFTMPTGAVVAQNAVSTDYKICLYSSTSTTAGKLLSSSTFTVANQPKVTAVLPSSGSALGGSSITVTGSDFPTTANAITATLGGLPLTSITPVDSGTFTAVTPAHAVGSVALTVTTAQGTYTLQDAFTYANSIKVSPNTAPSTATAQDVDVQGTGFLDYTFDSTANQGAHVYLVDGVYNATTDANSLKANGPVADCGNVLVISDNELICSLNLTAMLNGAGSAVVSSGRHTATTIPTSGSNIVTLASGSFNANDVGEAIVESGNTNIPANTTILAVLDPITAVLSADASATPNSAITVTIGYQRTATSTGANNGTTLTGNAGTFTQADVGRAVSGSNVGTNAVILAVNDTGTTATLSVSNTGSVSNPAVSSGNPVPDGAYNLTVVSNADEDANTSDDDYTQTIISSESIFTVASF